MSEKLWIHSNTFQDNMKTVFGKLREDTDFSDVTLACEDGQQVEAHKVILAASSPFFQKLLGRNKHPHPLIYMRGVKSDDILAILDFLYCGEANVFQENLDSFLAIAEELQLKGLMGKVDEQVQDYEEDNKSFITNAKTPKNSFHGPNSISRTPEENGTMAIPSTFSGDLHELEERVKSLMEKSANTLPHRPNIIAYICKVCGKEGQGNAIKDHIEANHLEGIIIPCNLCDKTFRSRNSFRQHKRQHQNKSI